MILTLKNEDDFIYSYIMWDTVDIKGDLQVNGEYLYIHDLWIHPHYRGLNCIRKFIHLLEQDSRTNFVKSVYWKREKYNDRYSKLINRFKIVKKGVYNVVR